MRLSRLSTRLRFITKRIIQPPSPPIFIFERDRSLLLFGSIQPNIIPSRSFFTLTDLCFFITLKPQNVKNSVTFLPVEAAPLAITNDANALSRSSLKTINVLLSLSELFSVHAGFFSPFSINASTIPAVLETLTNVAPVILHHAETSLAKPWSVALILNCSPCSSCSYSFLSCITGPGHCNPQASMCMILLLPCFIGLFIELLFAEGDCLTSEVAALYVLYPPERLAICVKPCWSNMR